MDKLDKKTKTECICAMCHSYVDCGESMEYCLPEMNVSKCIKEEHGCICPDCPVFEKMKLDRKYYCIR